MAHAFLAHLCLVHLCRVFKKSPAITIAQARELIARALEDEQDHRLDILSIITGQQKRNYAAYLSHRRHQRRKG